MAPASEDRSKAAPSRSPLLLVSLIASLVLIVPALLYSLAPEEPLQEGDVVFSTGRNVVYLHEPVRYQQVGYKQSCILEPGDQLVIVRKPEQPGEPIFARAEGKQRMERPFCPPKAEVIVKPHQVRKKEGLGVHIRKLLGARFAE